MSRFKIFNLVDKLFITVSIFLIIYAWINFFVRNLWVTFVLSLIFSWAIVYLLFYVLTKKGEKKLRSKSYFENIEINFLAFRLLDKFNQLNLIKTIVEKDNETINRNDVVLYKKDGELHQIMINTTQEKLSQNELVNMVSLREKNVKVLKIICQDFMPNINTKILKNLTILMIPKNKLYDNFFVAKNLFPDCSILETKITKPKLKNLAQNFLSPNKAKSFFLCGLVLIFSSIILPYHHYYLIFGTLLFVLGILCKLLPYFKR